MRIPYECFRLLARGIYEVKLLEMMKVTYIYHSGFAIELDSCVLLFDYYMGKLPEWQKDKKIYVFASHKHRDHFSFKVFDLANRYQWVHYFFGNDIKLNERYLERNHIEPGVKEKITNLGKNKDLLFDDIEIHTLKSTDAGVAFIVKAEGYCIYHAGDLNWWHWEGELPAFQKSMEQNYKKEIDSIKGMHFDAAFVPLDPRLDAGYGLGMDYFLENTKTDRVFPMHMWEEYGYIETYKKTRTGRQYADRIADIAEPGQEFDLWNI